MRGRFSLSLGKRVALLVFSALLSSSAFGDDLLDSVLAAGNESLDEAKGFQEQVDSSADRSVGLLADYRQKLKNLDGVKRHQEQLRATLELQELTMAELRASIDGVSTLLRDIPPLLERMLDSLDVMVVNDLPFKTATRRARIQGVRDNLRNSSISESQKVRQVLQAFEIETGFGRTIEAYEQLIDLDNTEREVEVLRWGRLALYYLTKDGRSVGHYNPESGAWEPLHVRHRIAIRRASQMAKNLATLDLVALPVQAPVDVTVERERR